MKPTKDRVVLDDMTVFIFWESFIASKKSKDENWRWNISKGYAKKINCDKINKVYRTMNKRFENLAKMGLFDVYVQKDNHKKIYSLRETDILFKKIKFADKKLSRALIIRIDD